MGWFNSAKNLAVKGVGVIGKVKDTVDKGLQMYDKGRNLYNEVKKVITDIGGDKARQFIAQREAQAQAAVKKKTGVDVGAVNKGVGVARQVSNETGNVLGVVGNILR